MLSLSAVPTAALTAGRAASAASASTSFARSVVPAPLPAPLSAASRAGRTHLLRCRAAAVEDGAVKEVPVEAEELSNGAAVAAPTVDEVQSLLMELCDETHIAELKVKVGAFSLHVKRDVDGSIGNAVACSSRSTPFDSPPPPPPTCQVGAFSLHVKRDVDGSIGHAVAAAEASAAAAAAPVVYAAPVPAFPMAESLPPAAAAEPVAEVAAEPEKPKDEGLVYVTSPRVGIMRRGKLYKGKHGRPIVLEGAVVKKGQAMCFLEQLGTNLAIETEHAGTVVDFLVEDGVPVGYGRLENQPVVFQPPSSITLFVSSPFPHLPPTVPVGYGEPLAAIRPSFPGIMKLT
ncbi:unnamed protein product [Closterium sp. NIES-65]|nr:unnamed protein product [Closterium sp. NIES-65]